MKSKSYLIAVLLLLCGAGGALVYGMHDRGSPAAVSRSHDQQGASGAIAHGTGTDHLNCHSHGPKTYHCH